MEGKNCTKCGEWKALTDYSKRRSAPDGLRCDCKTCASARQRAYIAEDAGRREAKYAETAAWHRNNRERLRAYRRRRYAEDPSGVKATRARQRDKLTDAYVAAALECPVSALTPELIEAKRIQLQIHRYLKENDNGN